MTIQDYPTKQLMPSTIRRPTRVWRWIAALLELVVSPGLGHYALGSLRRGLCWLGLNIIVFTVLVFAGIAMSREAFGAAFALGLMVRSAGAMDCLRNRDGMRPACWKLLATATLLLFSTKRVSMAVRDNLFQVAKMASASMQPTILRGDIVAISKIGREWRPGDVIAFRSPIDTGGLSVKRIAALAGASHESSVVPEGHVFVLGDNLDSSLDSRTLGSIPLQDVIGKVQFTW